MRKVAEYEFRQSRVLMETGGTCAGGERDRPWQCVLSTDLRDLLMAGGQVLRRGPRGVA